MNKICKIVTIQTDGNSSLNK